MKSFYLLIIAIISSKSLAQELIVKAKFENIQYVESIEWHNDDIYCAGYTFETKINDGNSTDAYLINYDTNLKPKWSLKISEAHSNIIYSIKRHKDKIYALVSQGEVQPLSRNLKISLFVITLNGEIESKTLLGSTFYNPSNITFDGDNLIFGHQVHDGTSYSSNSWSEIIKYNIVTKEIFRVKSEQYFSRPQKIIVDKSNIYLFGIYLHTNQPNIMTFRNGKYSQISLKPSKEEYFLDSYINENILTVVCVFPGAYGDSKKYLKFYYVNLTTDEITSTSISYENLGWKEARFYTFSTGNSSWGIIEDSKSTTLKYALINNKGKVEKTLNFDVNNGRSYWERYIFKPGKLLNANSSGIQIYKTE